MNKPVKAALLSAFIFPGAGHFFLKKHFIGAVLSGTAFVALYVVVTNSVERALQIAEKLQSGEVQLDVEAISELVSRQPTGAEAQSLSIAMVVLTVVWLAGITDSYRIGNAQDKGI